MGVNPVTASRVITVPLCGRMPVPPLAIATTRCMTPYQTGIMQVNRKLATPTSSKGASASSGCGHGPEHEDREVQLDEADHHSHEDAGRTRKLCGDGV